MADNGKKGSNTQEIIEAFDRERAEAHEHRRRHREWVRMSREKDRPAFGDRPRKPQ
jgi:hypothetical protein